jgi:uncharacterized protein (TIGR03437 family)
MPAGIRVVLAFLRPHCFWKLALVSYIVLPVLAQQPVINPLGIVNAASFAPDSERGVVLSPGGIFSIYGERLAASTLSATSSPLPKSLGGTSVSVGGVAAPLFFVSPNQINFQVPTTLTPDGTLPRQISVTVTTAAGVSNPVIVAGVHDALGIFTQNSMGCGQGAIQNVAGDGSVTLNTPDNSVTPGGLISVYATGLGSVAYSPKDGDPAPYDPLPIATSGGTGRLGMAEAYPIPLTPKYAGRAPGLIGVDQVNLKIPENAPEGCYVPLTLLSLHGLENPMRCDRAQLQHFQRLAGHR